VAREAGVRDGEPSALGRAFLTLLGRALPVERSALFVEEAPGRDLVPVAMQGRLRLAPIPPGTMPAGGPWSLTIPIRSGERTTGLLLLARAEGTPFSPADRALAEGLAAMAARVVEHDHTAAELERTRDLLARADRLSALGTLSAAVAHEIRNPLVSVRTFIQLLPERLDDEEFRTSFRDLALGEIERI
jgi:signal transduction histidine kinase